MLNYVYILLSMISHLNIQLARQHAQNHIKFNTEHLRLELYLLPLLVLRVTICTHYTCKPVRYLLYVNRTSSHTIGLTYSSIAHHMP